MSRPSLSAVLFWAAAVAVVVAHVVVASDSLIDKPLWEDEAFNLTVPRNLLAGYGYTSDGTLSGSTLTPWDVRISTGPVVLLPSAALMALGIDPVVAGRLVALAYWAALLVALALLGRRIGGRWGALAAVAAALALDATAGPSPLQGPADVLGEVPAAALTAWALVVLGRRAWLAGLLLGLAVQAKLIALLGLPALVVGIVVASRGTLSRRARFVLPRALTMIGAAVVPTATFEAAIAADPRSGYRQHLDALREFIRTGGQVFQGTTPGEKIAKLLASWWLPAGVVAAAVAGAVLLGVLSLAAARTGDADARTTPAPGDRTTEGAGRSALLAAASVGLLAYVAWWVYAAHTPLWVRHPTPGLLAFPPILTAFAVPVVERLRQSANVPLRAAGTVAAALAVVVIGAQVALHGAAAARPEPVALAAQRASAAGIVAGFEDRGVEPLDGYFAARPWGRAVPIVFLTGAHVGLWDARATARAPIVTNDDGCRDPIFADAVARACTH
jgi:hypothetical protein